MKYKRVELSAQNKPQYLIGLGVRDMELLLGEARNARRFMPRTDDNKNDIERLGGIVKGLVSAINEANKLGDTGEEVPIEDRHKFRSEYLDKITRFEVIDHRTCPTCSGSGRVLTETDSAAGQSTAFSKECPTCHGGGVPGRHVIFWSEDTKMTSSVQDEGRTLKVFLSEREEK